MLAETAKLLVQMDLGGNLSRGISGLERQLTGLNTHTGKIGQGFKTLGSGFLVAGIRSTALLAAQAGAVAGAIGVMVAEGQEAAKVQTVFATAIANSAKSANDLKLKLADLAEQQRGTKPNSAAWEKLEVKMQTLKTTWVHMGPVTAQQTLLLNEQQKALMNLAGVDDELIKTEQTRLIQMGLNGKAVQQLTPLILDMSKATGRDLLAVTLAVGKAINGNVAGLQRYGVVVDKTKAQVDPFAAVMEALNKKFGGTTKALSGSLEARLGAFRENLQNIREEAGQKLLPAIIRIVDVAGKDLVPAFGKFIDRVLPSLISGVEQFADMLENGGAERGIKAITDALGPMVDMLKIAAAPIKMIVGAFLSLPAQVQGVLIGAFAINKLSGGLIGQGIGQIAGGVFQRGSTPANPLFVADVTGGLGGVGGAAAGAAAGTGLALATAVLAPAAVFVAGKLIQDRVNRQGAALTAKAGGFATTATDAQLTASIAGIRKQLDGMQFNTFGSKNQVVATLNVLIAEQNRRATAGLGMTGALSLGDRDERAAGRVTARAELRASVLQRAVAAGFHPSAAAVERTINKQTAHIRGIIAAVKDVDSSVRALPAALKNALGGILYTGGGRPAIDDPIRPRKPSAPVSYPGKEKDDVITVKAYATTRDTNIAQTKKARLGPTADMVGAI